MTERQREIGRRGDVIMVGRDIGTVVLPEADLKLYLDASVEARARRRYEERQARGEEVTTMRSWNPCGSAIESTPVVMSPPCIQRATQ